MRERYAYDMAELDAKFQARARYNKRRDSQCREQKHKETRSKYCTHKRECDWCVSNRLHAAKREQQRIEDKWREYIEMPLANY